VTIRWAEFNEEDCTLDLDDLASKINKNTKLVAIGYASNAVGTINPVKKIVRLAHAAGALAYVDAVHYGPHGLIDVQNLDCDFLVCSTYKFFGPHMGVLFGKREHLARLRPYKVRPLTDAVPFRWEWGTLNHECIAGITACVDYIASLGTGNVGTAALGRPSGEARGPAISRRAAIAAAFDLIHDYEHTLLRRLMTGLAQIPNIKIYGITDPARFSERCPTIALRVIGQTADQTPLALATKLGDRGIFTWDGNYYALNVTERLDVEKSGGFLRIGLVHYNTEEEVDRLLAALREII
jgi:cysteine desulfurase family protein (TIGR01976 family)